MIRATPSPKRENLVLTKDLVQKLTEDHSSAMLRTLKLADDVAPNDNGVKFAIVHTDCLNTLYALFVLYAAGHGVKEKDMLVPHGKDAYLHMMTDLAESSWRYINHQLKD